MKRQHLSLQFSIWAIMVFCCASKALAMNAVYLQSNARVDNEVVLLLQEKDGDPLIYIEAYSTGGAGEPSINGNQSHALATNGKYLFVTNSGDDSVSTFRIGRSGSLSLLAKTSALGRHPVSLTVVQNNLIVLNQGDFNSKSLFNPNVQRFRILQDGHLAPLRGSYTYLPNAVPVDVISSLRGHTFSVILSGLSQIDRFKLEKDGAISRTGSTGGINNPLGGTIGRYDSNKIAVTMADDSLPGIASLITNIDGKQERLFQSIRPSLMDPCWAVTNSASTWIWSSAFQTRTLSLFHWQANGNIAFVSDFKPEDDGPGGLDLAISMNDKNLYWLRVDNVEDDSIPIRPYIDSFRVNPRSDAATAGLSLIGKTWLPEHWKNAKPTGILSTRVRR